MTSLPSYSIGDRDRRGAEHRIRAAETLSSSVVRVLQF
jgi:hypothetical protein